MSSRLACAALAALCACGTLMDSGGRSGIRRLGPDGGTVDSDLGVKLWLPAGALAAETTVMLVVQQPTPDGVERAVEVRPADVVLAKAGILTFAAPKADRAKVARAAAAGEWAALPGRRLDTASLSAPIGAFGLFAVIGSSEQCTGGVDDDGDGLADCADPACAGEPSCGLACTTSSDCACGAACVGGGCSAPNPRFCSAASDCSGVACAMPSSRGTACGFTACAVPSTLPGSDGGTQPRVVAACPAEADECACEACAGTNECPLGTTCRAATHKGGRELCGRDVCL